MYLFSSAQDAIGTMDMYAPRSAPTSTMDIAMDFLIQFPMAM